MINILSKINIIDNTGAKSGIMIKRLIPKTSTKNSPATVGHVISISVRKTIPLSQLGGGQKKNKILRKNVYQALIVRTKKLGNILSKKEYLKSHLTNSITNPLFSNNFETSISQNEKRNQLTTNCPPTNKWKINLGQFTLNLFKFNQEEKNYFFKNNLSSQKLGGHNIIWNDNAAILIKIVKSEFQPIGTRIKGPICKSLRMQKGCLKIVSISSNPT